MITTYISLNKKFKSLLIYDNNSLNVNHQGVILRLLKEDR